MGGGSREELESRVVPFLVMEFTVQFNLHVFLERERERDRDGGVAGVLQLHRSQGVSWFGRNKKTDLQLRFFR